MFRARSRFYSPGLKETSRLDGARLDRLHPSPLNLGRSTYPPARTGVIDRHWRARDSEHSVNESFSGDGLIAVSFDDRDRDFVVPVSHARGKESLFGEMEVDLAASEAKRLDAERIRTDLTSERDAVQAELFQVGSERDFLRGQLGAISGTKMWRWSRRPRQIYQRVRRG
jgi:hypothetical protein